MKSILLTLLMTILAGSFAFANQYDDLREFAKQVPTSMIDKEVFNYIENETNETLDGVVSSYTLALYEDIPNSRFWYILDGYFKLKSGRILFLDFEYNPKTKVWWPIENYKYHQPASTERFLLEADEACNSYKRHFIGLLKTSLGAVTCPEKTGP